MKDSLVFEQERFVSENENTKLDTKDFYEN